VKRDIIRFAITVPRVGDDVVDVAGLVHALALAAHVDGTRAAVRSAGGNVATEHELVAAAVTDVVAAAEGVLS